MTVAALTRAQFVMGAVAVGYELSEQYCKLIVDRNRQGALEMVPSTPESHKEKGK